MRSQREFKDGLYAQLARVGKALAAPKRLELLDLLAQGPRTVEALADQAAISLANASQHLRILRAACLVDSQKMGLHVEYRLADQRVLTVFVAMRNLAQARLAEVDRITAAYFNERATLEPVARDELLRRVRSGAVTILDVRPKEEHAAGRLPGAISIPLAQLRARLGELPTDRDVVAYCRGPYCVMAVEAARLLRKRGFRAYRLELGVADWRARGWRLETGRLPA